MNGKYAPRQKFKGSDVPQATFLFAPLSSQLHKKKPKAKSKTHRFKRQPSKNEKKHITYALCFAAYAHTHPPTHKIRTIHKPKPHHTHLTITFALIGLICSVLLRLSVRYRSDYPASPSWLDFRRRAAARRTFKT